MTTTERRPSANSGSEEFPNPFGDLEKYAEDMKRLQEKEAAEKAREEQANEGNESDVRRRRIIAAGDRSTLYNVEYTNGKEGRELESDYLEISSQFRKSHENLQDDFGLNLAMIGISTDIAIIDATKGDSFNNADETMRAALLKDYGILRERLDDPNSSQMDKSTITEYFDQMQGFALDFIKTQYDQSKGRFLTPEHARTQLDQIKDEVENSRKKLDEDYQNYQLLARQVKQLLNPQERNNDMDLLQTKVGQLRSAIDEAIASAQAFRQLNDSYAGAFSRNRNEVGLQYYQENIAKIKKDDDTVVKVLQTLNNADENARILSRQLGNS